MFFKREFPNSCATAFVTLEISASWLSVVEGELTFNTFVKDFSTASPILYANSLLLSLKDSAILTTTASSLTVV